MSDVSRRTLLILAPALACVARARAADEPGQAVTIDNFAFNPQQVTVPKGTAVTWTNRDDIPHQVVCPAAKLKSKVLDTDQSDQFRFEQPGSYEYFCALHPHMQGKIVVT